MIEINRGRINLLLSSASFTISSAGSVLLHIVLAVTIYAKTGSGLMTSLFVSLQWLPALLVVLYRSDWDHGMNPRTRWIALELTSAVLTVPVLFFVANANYLAVAVVLLVRGLVDHVNRINKTVAARVLFPKAKSTHYASILQSSYHVGIGLAAVIGIFIANSVDLWLVVVLDALSFVVAASLISLSRTVEAAAPNPGTPRRPLKARVAEYRDALSGDRRLLICAALPPLTATFFQGTYSALQPIFPIQKLGLDSSAVSASYVLASVAIVVGSSSFSFFLKKHRLFEQPGTRIQFLAGALSLLTAGLYVGAVSTANPLASAALFTLMVVAFEFTWMMGYSGIVAFAPKGQLGSVFSISFALGCFFASVLAAVVGALLDVFGNNYFVLIGLLMLAYLSIIGLVILSYKPPVPAYSDEAVPARE